jgi:hypothetical protein
MAKTAFNEEKGLSPANWTYNLRKKLIYSYIWNIP